MARKLTYSIRIAVAVVALMLGTAAAEASHADAQQQHGRHVMAEDKGPTVANPVTNS